MSNSVNALKFSMHFVKSFTEFYNDIITIDMQTIANLTSLFSRSLICIRKNSLDNSLSCSVETLAGDPRPDFFPLFFPFFFPLFFFLGGMTVYLCVTMKILNCQTINENYQYIIADIYHLGWTFKCLHIHINSSAVRHICCHNP